MNQKTDAKWRKRESVCDLPIGPKEPKSTVLMVEEQAIIVAFRRRGERRFSYAAQDGAGREFYGVSFLQGATPDREVCKNFFPAKVFAG